AARSPQPAGSRLRRDRTAAQGVPSGPARRRFARSLGQLLHQQPAGGLHRHRRRARRPARAVHEKGVSPRAPQGPRGLRAPSARDRAQRRFRARAVAPPQLDHGTCIPLCRIGVDSELPIVPVIGNDLEDPMPSIRRWLAWGRLLRQAIESYPEPLRVAVLGTGGLSHSIGEPTMGWIDEEFDHACIRHFEDGEDARLAAFLTEALARTGNGAHEIRDWVIAHAAAGSKGFELIDYFPSPQTLVGAGFASWRVTGSA